MALNPTPILVCIVSICIITICSTSFMNVTIPSNFTTPFPVNNNCTENVIPTFNRLRSSINVMKSKSMNKIRPIDPYCIVPDIEFNYTFMPNFYCPSMVHKLYCNKTEELQYLHKFYYALNGDNWKNKTHWITKKDYCKWYGVYCCNTSYPLYQTCINIIWMDDNNLIGTLPSPWINSTVLTVFSASYNHITGTIPNYHDRLPNLSIFAINPDSPDHPDTDSISGALPDWPSAGCMVWFDVHNNVYLNGPLPDWNIPLKYTIAIALSATSFTGTLPRWTEWQWPYHLTIANQFGNLTGTISPFTNALCPTLDRLYLYSMNLEGTMPPLPLQLYDIYTADPSIYLHGNKLTGTFPWYSLNQIAFLTLQDNQFTGNMILPADYKHFRAINISNNNFNGMFPCLMKNRKLEFIDARFNKFDSIGTDKEDDCIAWPQTLRSLFLSDNQINAPFDRAVRNLTNLTVIDFGNNNFKGTVPALLVEGKYNGTYISFYDNDFSCTFPDADGRHFNGSWIYIGNGMKAPWAPYTNQYEKGLGIIAIAPNDEITYYLATPLIIGVSLFLLYAVGTKFGSDEHTEVWIKTDEQHPYELKRTKHKILCIMQQSVIFVGYISIIAMMMIIFYTLGANFYKCGYVSLQPTITYMGTLSGDGYDIYSWISIILFLVYSLLCTWFVVKLMYFSKWFEPQFNDNEQQNSMHPQFSNIINTNPRTSSFSSFSNRHNRRSKPNINNNNSISLIPSVNSDGGANPVLPGNNKQNEETNSNAAVSNEVQHGKCWWCAFCIWWFIKFVLFFITFLVLLFGPIIAYNIYHSVPYTHMRYVPEINTKLFQHFVIYILPFVLAVGKFFGIPFANDQMRSLLIEIGIVNRDSHNTWRNATLCCIRFITMIFLPIIILLIFDDGCSQNWKSWWDYCDIDDNGEFIHPQCETIAPKFKDLPGSATWICHAVCNKKFVPYRCMRRFFEVLGPLYLYKMNIALWFPLLYFTKQTKAGKCVLETLKNCWNKIICKCCSCCKWGDDESESRIKMDVEYMSLVSSLEIVIVFGWAIPILVILYGITIFGYWCVYSYWFNNSGVLKFRNRKTLQPVTGWLILSLILQHILACFFYWYTQSIKHGVVCIGITFINIIWFIGLLLWYRIITVICKKC